MGVAEHAHVDAELRDQGRRHDSGHPGDLLQSRVLGEERSHLLVDTGVERVEVLGEEVEAAQLQLEQEAVVVAERALEGIGQVGELETQLSLGQIGNLLGSRLTLRQGTEHEHPGHSAAER